MDYNDLYNSIETKVVTALKSDAWLGDGVHIRLIHEKLRDDLSSYRGNEVPALAVEVREIIDEGNRNNSIFTEEINVLIEVTCSGSKRAELDKTVKEIISRIRHWMRGQCRSYGPGSPFLGDAELIPVGNGEAAFMGGEGENAYVQIGTTIIEMRIINKS